MSNKRRLSNINTLLRERLRGRRLLAAHAAAAGIALALGGVGLFAIAEGMPHAAAVAGFTITGLVLLTTTVMPLLCIAHHWEAHERLENAVLAVRMTLSRCQAAQTVLIQQSRLTAQDLHEQSRLIDAALTECPRGLVGTQVKTRHTLLSVDSALRKRMRSLEVIPKEAALISDSLRMLGMMISAPKVLPELAPHLERVFGRNEAATRTAVSVAEASHSPN